MEIYKQQTGDTIEMRVAGRLDGYWADHLSEALEEVIRGGAHHVRLNLSETTFLSSAGIRVLVQVYKQLRGIEGSFQVVRPSENISKVLDLAGLKAMLIGTGRPVPSAPAPAAPIATVTTLDRASATLHVHTLDPSATLRCRLLGNPDLLLGCRFEEKDCRAISASVESFALGLGALGNHFADCKNRFGEFLAATGSVAYQPADGSSVPDYSLSEGSFIPEIQCLYGLQCTGSFSRLVRFEAKPDTRALPLTELLEAALDIESAETIGIVVIAETLGLVGAALKRSPTQPSSDPEIPFRHPEIRNWLSFTAERAFARSMALIVGVATRSAAGPLVGFLRPYGTSGALHAHLHAAAFTYAPLQKGVIEMQTAVSRLFSAQSLQGVLHLVNDDREIAGAGQSAFFRGACWLAPLGKILEEKE